MPNRYTPTIIQSGKEPQVDGNLWRWSFCKTILPVGFKSTIIYQSKTVENTTTIINNRPMFQMKILEDYITLESGSIIEVHNMLRKAIKNLTGKDSKVKNILKFWGFNLVETRSAETLIQINGE